MLAQALAFFQAGRMADAERVARGLVAAEPESFEAHELLGAALSAQGRAQEALPFFDRARELRPQSPSIRHNRAQALFALGRFAESREEVGEAVRLKPDLYNAWNLLGNAHAARDPARFGLIAHRSRNAAFLARDHGPALQLRPARCPAA